MRLKVSQITKLQRFLRKQHNPLHNKHFFFKWQWSTFISWSRRGIRKREREEGTSLWKDLALESGLLRCAHDLGSMPLYFLSGINLSNGMACDHPANQPYQIYQKERMKTGPEDSCSGWVAGYWERHTRERIHLVVERKTHIHMCKVSI